MKKIAFFVEGVTEQLFVARLFEAVCAEEKLAIQSMKGKGGGGKVSISFFTIRAANLTDKAEFYVLIVDCSGENNIRSYIDERREGLIAEGFCKIIGIRDVFPNVDRQDIHSLLYGLSYRLPQTPIRTDFILGVMEVEAWFLSEHTHFAQIHKDLNCELIRSNLNFDPEAEDMELRDTPAQDLHNAYQLVGEAYRKELPIIQRTIDSINYTSLYFEPKVSSVKKLIAELDQFIS